MKRAQPKIEWGTFILLEMSVQPTSSRRKPYVSSQVIELAANPTTNQIEVYVSPELQQRVRREGLVIVEARSLPLRPPPPDAAIRHIRAQAMQPPPADVALRQLQQAQRGRGRGRGSGRGRAGKR